MSTSTASDTERAETGRAAAGEVLARLGLPVDLELIRSRASSVFRAPQPGLALKVSPYDNERLIAQQHCAYAVSRWLHGRGAKVNEPALPEPVDTPGGLVCVYYHLTATGEADAKQAGELLADIHRHLVDYPGELPDLNPLATGERTLAELRDLTGEQARMAHDLWESALRKWHRIRVEFDSQPLHGDYHTGNMLRTSAGLVAIDFDGVCRGPAVWDAVTINPRRTIGVSDWPAFCAGYGRDLADSPHFEPLRNIQSSMVTLWMLRRDEPEVHAGGLDRLYHPERIP